MANRKRIATSVAAVATAAALLLGGTFAWQSVNQTALNEASDVINPGGRLHNDMWYVSETENNHDIYVENFANEEIFARVRLSEYMEIVVNRGTPGETVSTVTSTPKTLKENAAVDRENNPTDANLYDYTYDVHFFDGINVTDEYWDWQTGGETVFMPTFNKNKDSLAADLNGLYVDSVGGISDRGEAQYSTRDVWNVGDTKPANAVYDYDDNTDDELDRAALSTLISQQGTDAGAYADYVALVEETHEAKVTQSAALISMSEWLTLVNDEGGYDAGNHGNYWVYDTDGWVYWSAPIPAGEATGLLLDGITLKQVMDDSWYYAIEAVGQFVTADDAGKGDGTGFYADGEDPSGDAETLLEAIGVTLDGSEDDDWEEEHFNELVLDYDASNNVVKGGEMIEFWADVYDENGNRIAGTDEVEFTATEILASEVAAVEESGQSFMGGNFLIVADDVLERDVKSVTVTATYADEDGNEYSAECEFVTEAEESPLKTKLLYSGVEVGHLSGGDPVFQVFTHDPSEESYEFTSTLNGETVAVEWGLNEYYEYYTVTEDENYVYALSTEWWSDEGNGWSNLEIGTQIAKIHKNSGEFEVLIGDAFPMSCAFEITSRTVDETDFERHDILYIAKRVVEFQLREQGNVSFGDTYYTPGANTEITIEPYILKEGQQIPQNEITEEMVYDWDVYVGEYYTDDSEKLTSNTDYTLVYNGDGTWTLTILDPVEEDSIFVRAFYDYGKATPHYSDGIHKADLRIKNIATASSGIPNSMEIYDDNYETESTYTPGEYSKIRLEAELYDAMGEYVYRSNIIWQVAGSNVRVVGNGSSAELQIRGATDETITVYAIYDTEIGSGETNLQATYCVTADDGSGDDYYEPEPTFSFYIDADPVGYTPGLSTNNITLTANANFGGEDVLENVTLTNWRLSGNMDEETVLTDNGDGTKNLYVSSSETASITVSVDYEYEGESGTYSTTIPNHPQVATMTVYDDDTESYLGSEYRLGEETTVNLTAFFFETRDVAIKPKEDAYSDPAALEAIGSHVSWYLVEAHESNVGTVVPGVTVSQDGDKPWKVAIVIDSTVEEDLIVRCDLDSGMRIDYDITAIS